MVWINLMVKHVWIEVGSYFKLKKDISLPNFWCRDEAAVFDNFNVPLTPNGFAAGFGMVFWNILNDYIQITFSQVEGFLSLNTITSFRLWDVTYFFKPTAFVLTNVHVRVVTSTDLCFW